MDISQAKIIEVMKNYTDLMYKPYFMIGDVVVRVKDHLANWNNFERINMDDENPPSKFLSIVIADDPNNSLLRQSNERVEEFEERNEDDFEDLIAREYIYNPQIDAQEIISDIDYYVSKMQAGKRNFKQGGRIDNPIMLPDTTSEYMHLKRVLNKQGYDITHNEMNENYEVGGVVKHKHGVTTDGTEGGYFDGRPHSEGGIKAVNIDTGTPIEVEGGEVVITKDAVADKTKREFMGKKMTNKEILSYINQSGGGVALAKGGEIRETEFKMGGYIDYIKKYITSGTDTNNPSFRDYVLRNLKYQSAVAYYTQYFAFFEVRRTLANQEKIRKGDYVIYKSNPQSIEVGFAKVINARSKINVQIQDTLTGRTLAVEREKLVKSDSLIDGFSNDYFYGNLAGNIPLEFTLKSMNYAIKIPISTTPFYFATSEEAANFINLHLDKSLQITAYNYTSTGSRVESIFWGRDYIQVAFKDGNDFEDYLIGKFNQYYYIHQIYLNSLILKKTLSPNYPIKITNYYIDNPFLNSYIDYTDDVGYFIREFKILSNKISQTNTANTAINTLTLTIKWEDKSLIKIDYNLASKPPNLIQDLMLLSGWFDGSVDTTNVTFSDLKQNFALYGWDDGLPERENYIDIVSEPIIDNKTIASNLPTRNNQQKAEIPQNIQELQKPSTPKSTYSILNEYNNSIESDLKELTFILANTPEYEFETRTSLGQEIARLNYIISKYEESEIVDDDIIEDLLEADSMPNEFRPTRAANANAFQPNGDFTTLTSAQLKIVNNPNFSKWFGNYKDAYNYNKIYANDPIPCSKVVTEGGEPLVVYMGVGREFEAVRFNRFPIAYFAVNYDYAEWFAETKNANGGWVLPFFLDIKNPLDLTIFGINKVAPKDFYDWLFLQTGMTAEEFGFIGAWQNPQMPPIEVWMYIRNNKAFLNILKESKIVDGIHFYENNPSNQVGDSNYSTEVWSTFYPNQSKLASAERGKYILSSVDTFKMSKGGKLI
jgi:hypothetical protein